MPDDDFPNQLVERAKAGEVGVAPLLVSVLGDRLLGYAHAHAPDLSDADREQIVELAVEAGVRSIGQYDSDRGTLFSWFRRQVVYRTADWRRSHPSVMEANDQLALEVQDEPSAFDDPEIAKRIAAAIAQLSFDDRMIFALRGSERMHFGEIGLRLAISEDAARQRYKRAKERLRPLVLADDRLRLLIRDPEEGENDDR